MQLACVDACLFAWCRKIRVRLRVASAPCSNSIFTRQLSVSAFRAFSMPQILSGHQLPRAPSDGRRGTASAVNKLASRGSKAFASPFVLVSVEGSKG